jgi:hypothetical protein
VLAERAGRDPVSARHVARSILDQPQFHQAPENPLERLYNWAGHTITDLLNDALSGHATPLGVAVLVAVLALLVWLLVRGVRGLQAEPVATGVPVGSLHRPAADWIADAEAAERAGDWRTAVQARYRALVTDLARRGLVQDSVGRTSGEYRAEVARSHSSAADDFGTVTDLFERTVYGDEPSGPADAEVARAASSRILSRAGGRLTGSGR